jgi:hypothetical protein
MLPGLSARACAVQTTPDHHADGEKQPAHHHRPRVHGVEHMQRRQPRVEVSEVLLLDLLELQHVGEPEHRREREARVGEEQRCHVHPEPGTIEHRVCVLDPWVQHRNHLQADHDRHDEDTHRAFIGRELEIQIRERQHPDERRDGARQIRNRHVPHFHRLHADHERVRERTEEQQRRRGTADAGLPPHEVHRVNHARGGVQNEGDQIQRGVGA